MKKEQMKRDKKDTIIRVLILYIIILTFVFTIPPLIFNFEKSYCIKTYHIGDAHIYIKTPCKEIDSIKFAEVEVPTYYKVNSSLYFLNGEYLGEFEDWDKLFYEWYAEDYKIIPLNMSFTTN